MTINSILINDVALDLADIEYNVQISHGRADIKSVPEPSTAQIILRGSTGTTLAIGDELAITAYTGTSRFTGTVTDLSIEYLSSSPAIPVTTVTAIGLLARLGLLTTGEDAYPKESPRDRITTIMDTTGLSYLNVADADLELKSNNDPGITTILSYLQSVAEWSGGTYFDDTRGRVIFEDYGNRGIASNPGIWENLTEPWSFYEDAWSTFPTNNAAPSIPGSSVAWSPQWQQNLQTLINDVEIEYDNGGLYELEDAASIAAYGRRKYDLLTELHGLVDAQERAQQIITAQANPLWNIGQITVLMDQLTETQRNSTLALLNGANVIIDDIPAGGPYTQFNGIVEGWSETYVPGRHLLTLTLSDPRYSYQTVTWGGVEATLTWGNVNATLQWYNAVNADDLLAA
jgi:hypothetical protein